MFDLYVYRMSEEALDGVRAIVYPILAEHNDLQKKRPHQGDIFTYMPNRTLVPVASH